MSSCPIPSFPTAILHIDGDAFFASCEQALQPKLKGKPVVVGLDRGIATSYSYEAKRRGVRRSMTISQIKKVCPDVILLPSDYESYSLFSKQMFTIMRRFSSLVEEYSIDEGFMDITGLQGPLRQNYEAIAQTIKQTIQKELDITVSVGLAPTKVLAKLASSWSKPDGYAHIRLQDLPDYLRDFSVDAVWGIGPNTAAYMRERNIFSAYDFAIQPRAQVEEYFTKPHQDIWHELNGRSVYPVIDETKTSYASISKTKTFTPTNEATTVYAELIRNLENTCSKARRYALAGTHISIFLKDQNFAVHTLTANLSRPSAYPAELIAVIKPLFEKLYEPGITYRASGTVLSGLQEGKTNQISLFESPIRLTQLKQVYQAIDKLAVKFGNRTVHAAASLPAKSYEAKWGSLRFALPVLTLT